MQSYAACSSASMKRCDDRAAALRRIGAHWRDAYRRYHLNRPWSTLLPTRDELEALIEPDRVDTLRQIAGGAVYEGLGAHEHTPDEFPYCQRRPYLRRETIAMLEGQPKPPPPRVLDPNDPVALYEQARTRARAAVPQRSVVNVYAETMTARGAPYRVQLADRLHAIMPPVGVPSPAPRDFLITIAELAHTYKQSLHHQAVVVYSDLMNASEYRGRR
jgi:hypothetical protein